MFSDRLDPAQHPQHRLVGAAVQRAVERGDAGGDRRVGVDLRGAHAAHGVRRAVLLVVGVQDEEDVEGALAAAGRARTVTSVFLNIIERKLPA